MLIINEAAFYVEYDNIVFDLENGLAIGAAAGIGKVGYEPKSWGIGLEAVVAEAAISINPNSGFGINGLLKGVGVYGTIPLDFLSKDLKLNLEGGVGIGGNVGFSDKNASLKFGNGFYFGAEIEW